MVFIKLLCRRNLLGYVNRFKMYHKNAKISIILVLISPFFTRINCLYEDQAGKVDWKRSFIGKPKFGHIESGRTFVVTEENVLACLNTKNGEILWRQQLEKSNDEDIVYFNKIPRGIVTVSACKSSYYVRGWEANSGTLQWEWLMNNAHSESYWSIQDDKLVRVGLNYGKNVDINVFDMENGSVKKGENFELDYIEDSLKCALNQNYFACIVDNNNSVVKVSFIDINNGKIQRETVEFEGNGDVSLLDFQYKSPAFSIIRDGRAKIIHFESGKMEIIPKLFASNVVNVNGVFYELEINLKNPEKLLRIKSENDEIFDVEYPRGLGAPYILTGNSGVFLLVTMDHSVILLRLANRKIEWTREESLVNIVASEFFELPVSEHEATIENEFKTTGNLLEMFVHRITTQLNQFSNFLLGANFLKNNVLVRDDFGLHKIIVMATKVGKLIGVDTITGSVIWTYRLPHFEPFETGLLVQRTSKYSPMYTAQCTLIGKNLLGESLIFRFDPITGKSLGSIEKIEAIKQVTVLPYEDEEHLRPFLVMNQNGEVDVYPEKSRKVVSNHLNSIYFYIVEEDRINGYGIIEKGNGFSTELRWNFEFSPGKLVGISQRPQGERVHSQGRVLPDRSVYYKYVNPNLIAIAVSSDDPVHRQVLNVYLIDGITGFVIHSVAHKRVKSPFHLAHSENWLVYTLFNEKYRRTELVSLELYEGHVQNNSTVFSSFAMSQLPQVQTQSYILPASPVKLTVTLTERGITNKCILVALNTGSVVEIPWGLIQPRFADIPCGPEESCYPYMPELPMQAEATINYNQTLAGVRGISVAPARLESTSHVLVHGLDMFYTRVAPSKTFDVLKEDFDYKLIVLVLIGMIGASYLTKILAAKKAMKQAWN